MVSRSLPLALLRVRNPGRRADGREQHVQRCAEAIMVLGSLAVAVLGAGVQDLGHAREDQPDRARQRATIRTPAFAGPRGWPGHRSRRPAMGGTVASASMTAFFSYHRSPFRSGIMPPDSLPFSCVPARVRITRARSKRRARMITNLSKTIKVDVARVLSACRVSGCTGVRVCGVRKGDRGPLPLRRSEPEMHRSAFGARRGRCEAGAEMSRLRFVCGIHVSVCAASSPRKHRKR